MPQASTEKMLKEKAIATNRLALQGWEEYHAGQPKHDHEQYLTAKLAQISTIPDQPVIVGPIVSAEEIEPTTNAIKNRPSKQHPSLADMSYLEFLVEKDGIIQFLRKGDNNFDPYKYYLNQQYEFIADLLKTPPSPVIVENGLNSEPVAFVEGAKQREKQPSHIRAVLLVAFGFTVIAGVFTAHRLGMLDGMLATLQQELTPTPTLASPPTETISPTLDTSPTFMPLASSTPTPTEINPIPTNTGEGNKPENEYIKLFDGKFDPDSEPVLATDLFVCGGLDSKSTYYLHTPNDNGSTTTLENPINPLYLMRFNPDDGHNRWERITLPQDHAITNIVFKNNRGADAIIIYWEGGSMVLNHWEYFDPKEPSTQEMGIEKWSTTITGLIETGTVFRQQHQTKHLPLEAGEIVIYDPSQH